MTSWKFEVGPASLSPIEVSCNCLCRFISLKYFFLQKSKQPEPSHNFVPPTEKHCKMYSVKDKIKQWRRFHENICLSYHQIWLNIWIWLNIPSNIFDWKFEYLVDPTIRQRAEHWVNETAGSELIDASAILMRRSDQIYQSTILN